MKVFVNDYVFDGTGDLDIHNGRFVKLLNFLMEYMLILQVGFNRWISNK